MKVRLSVNLGPSDSVSAGPGLEEELWLRIEGRGRGAVILGMNEYQANDIIEALKLYAKTRPGRKS